MSLEYDNIKIFSKYFLEIRTTNDLYEINFSLAEDERLRWRVVFT